LSSTRSKNKISTFFENNNDKEVGRSLRDVTTEFLDVREAFELGRALQSIYEIQVESSQLDVDEDEIGEEDYGFIFDADGNLKFAFIPEVLPNKPPKNIAKIMKILGVIDLAQFNEDLTIH
jgi:hypothetical protein